MSKHQKLRSLNKQPFQLLFAMLGRDFMSLWQVADGTFYAQTVDGTIVEANSPKDALIELLYQSNKNARNNLAAIS